MRKEVKEFLKSDRRFVIYKRDKDTDVVSEWLKLRPFRAPVNFIIISTLNLCPSMKLKNFMFRNLLGMKIGKNVGFAPVHLDPLFPDLVSLGDNAALGWMVKILCHEFTQERVRIGRVSIGENTLIRAFTSIRSGVKIGKNSVVSMNSFVNKDIPDNEFWAGVPARRIKKLNRMI